MLAFATDELSKRVGQTLAGLINATLVRTALGTHPDITNALIQGNAYVSARTVFSDFLTRRTQS